MRSVLRWLVRLVLVAMVGIGGFFLYMVFKPPRMAPPRDIRVEATPERLARGRRLFEVICDCNGCHAQRDFSRFGGPVVPGTEGQGWGPMALEGLPGTVVVPNITPDRETGIGAWTDGEIIRAIREGIGRDGRALFPFMPYPNYRRLSDEDVYALVAYLRSLPPIKKHWPRTRLNFPVNLFVKDVPRPTGPVARTDPRDKAAYGEYLMAIAACNECHTPAVRGELVAEKMFAGGRVFTLTGVSSVASSNITPDKDTGIGVWTEEHFIHKFRSYLPYAEGESPKVGAESFTLMPWLNYARMTDEELSAIYAALRTLKPIYNPVEKRKGFEPAMEPPGGVTVSTGSSR